MHLLYGFSCCLSTVSVAIQLFRSQAQNLTEGELSWQKSTLFPEDLKTPVIGKQHLAHQSEIKGLT